MDSFKRQRATYQDVLDAPEHIVAEIIGGELRLSPRPGGPATALASAISHKLGSLFGSDGGGWLILYEPELHIAEEIVVPNLAGWRLERMPFVPEGAFFTMPPDWICEVLSKSTEKMDRTEKMPIYVSFGVQHAWLVQPRRRVLEAFCLREDAWVPIGIYRDTDRVRIKPFDALEIDLAALWAHVPLPTRASEPQAPYEYDGP